MSTDDAPVSAQTPYSDGRPYPITPEVLAGILQHADWQDQRQPTRLSLEAGARPIPFGVFATQALRSLAAEVRRLWSPPDGTLYLHRHGCGHYELQQSSPRLEPGHHASISVRISTTDANCIACEMRPGLDADPNLRKMAAIRFERRRRMLAEHR